MPRHDDGIYRPIFRCRNGKKKRSKYYWMSYQCKIGCPIHTNGGKQHQESTKRITYDEAKAERAAKVGDITQGRPVNGNEILIKELLDAVVPHAMVHNKPSTASGYADTIRNHLEPYFRNYKVIDLCVNEAIITQFIAKKMKDFK